MTRAVFNSTAKFWLAFLAVLLSLHLTAEVDSTIQDGIYISPKDFGQKNAILKGVILTKKSPADSIFYSQVLRKANLKFLHPKSGKPVKIPSYHVWGYVESGILYIQYQNEFCRAFQVDQLWYYKGRFITQGVQGMLDVQEKHFFFDPIKLHSQEVNLGLFEQLFVKDESIRRQLKKIARNQQNDSLGYFIHQYNLSKSK